MRVSVGGEAEGRPHAVLVLLASSLHQEDSWEEDGEEPPLVFVAAHRVHLRQLPGSGESLVAHVESVDEGELSGHLLSQLLVVGGHVDVLASILDDLSKLSA